MRITRVDLWFTTRLSLIKQRLQISRIKKKLGIVSRTRKEDSLENLLRGRVFRWSDK